MSVKLNVVMQIPGKEPRAFEYEFDQPRIQLGRDQDNDIQIPLSTVSRHHAVLYEEGGEWYVEDQRSTHGTKHNGKQVGAGGKKLLRNGDVIEIVHFKITFHHGEMLSDGYSSEKTEALAQKMVREVLAAIGSAREVPYLRVMNGPDEGVKFELGPEVTEVVIGRGADCDFQINDANISRRHAVVRHDWNDITIEDLGSKNGVVVNDKRITEPVSLRDADEILLGAVRLTFIDPSAKFIGKLDDIPAFQDNTRGEESAVVDEEEDQESEVRSAGPANETGAVPPAPSGEEPPVAEERPDSPDAPEGDPAPEPGEGPAPIGADDDTSEGTGTGLPVEAKKGLGVVEYALIGLAALVGVGLLAGVLILLLG